MSRFSRITEFQSLLTFFYRFLYLGKNEVAKKIWGEMGEFFPWLGTIEK